MIKTRFAPSPTGNLHIGGARTALYSYLWAKKNKGKFLLRIEDTDRTRYQPEAETSIFEGLQWLGLHWDETVEYQSQHTTIYREHIQQLINNATAYYCFCTPERLQVMREIQQKKQRAPKYDKTCLRLSAADIANKLANHEAYVVRLNIPNEGSVIIDDMVRGKITFQCAELDDQILLKSDGFPTYHLANVVDDHMSGITHVIRGEEWIPSTPKHILLYQAFGWTPPQFAHLSLFINKGGGKMSKREGATSLLEYKRLGYLPAAIINFIALLGWNPKTTQEIFTVEELIAQFDLSQIHTANPIFDTNKLDWYNNYYIQKVPLTELVQLCLPYLPPHSDLSYAQQIVALEQPRLKRLCDITEITDFFFMEKLTYDPSMLVWKKSTPVATKNYLQELAQLLTTLAGEWTSLTLEHAILPWIEQKGYTNGDVLWPLRVAVTGKKASPPPFAVAAILGKTKTLQRIHHAITLI